MAMERGSGWRALGVEDVEALPWRHTELRWLPLRHALDTLIVGIGGFVAVRAGQPVVEDHVETSDGRGHEGRYLVVRGRATFTLDGAGLDAPAGRFLLVDDPGVRRSAIAAEPDTVVVAFGGPPVSSPPPASGSNAHARTPRPIPVAHGTCWRISGSSTPAARRYSSVRLLDDPDIGPLLPG